jgi:hypothetical protein
MRRYFKNSKGKTMTVKAILGYDIEPGLRVEEYEKWLWEVHVPDLSRIPGLRRIVFNTVKGTVRGDQTFYRVAELHYDDMAAFEKAAAWRRENPVPPERSPEGRTAFRFYVVCESRTVDVIGDGEFSVQF